MNKAVLFFAMGWLLMACQPNKPADTDNKETAKGAVTKESLKTQSDKLNYAVGIEIGKNIKRNGLDLNEAIFLKGIHDGLSEAEPLLADEEMMKVKRDHSTAQREKRKKEREELGKKNKEAAAKFLAENGKKEGIVTTASGLQYKILTEGKGPLPVATDRVKVNYKGTLIDGTEFDSSYKRNEPATFSVNRVVKGWTEALQLMPVGSKWQIFIPPDLGYGAQGAGEKIGPESVLIFEMELVEIVKEDPNAKKMTMPMNPNSPTAGGLQIKTSPAKPEDKKAAPAAKPEAKPEAKKP
jgi:FKBP-type peptidyl-prolyl cis-trans isomerase